MEERWPRLAVTAHNRGCLDYSQPVDWRFKLKENLIFDIIEDELIVETNKLVHNWHCSAAQVTGWDEHEQLFDYHSKKARLSYNKIGRMVLPWHKGWQAEEKSLAQLWKEFKAEEKDPLYVQRLTKIRTKLLKDIADRKLAHRMVTEAHSRFEAEKKKREQEAKERSRRRNHGRLHY